ncbi:hypothetical protein ElyMa_005935400 [Elysia marginata]|uniref:Uncharacterized protein n=1 Tax=Elysia marginata TaxID=1093978 RepID=A0AAV4G9Z8_9GAST|nr:hypothetical protein ElyMa_005935400 [Elysia marginata]
MDSRREQWVSQRAKCNDKLTGTRTASNTTRTAGASVGDRMKRRRPQVSWLLGPGLSAAVAAWLPGWLLDCLHCSIQMIQQVRPPGGSRQVEDRPRCVQSPGC